MRKSFVLLTSIFLALFLGIILSVSLYRTHIQLKAIELQIASSYAFYAAETGIERAVFELRRDRNWRAGFGDKSSPISLSLQNGQIVGFYWIDADGLDNVSNNIDDDIQEGGNYGVWPQTLWIRCWGQDPERRVTRVIFARIATQSPTAYFLSTPGDLVVRSGANFDNDILGREVSFKPSLDPINISGNVFYITEITGEEDPLVHVDADGDGIEEEFGEDIRKIPPITFAGIDLSWYKSIFDSDGDGDPDRPGYYEGGFSYSGEINRDEIENFGGLIFVDGDVHIAGAVTDSFHIVATGDIYIEGDIICEDNTQIGLSAKGDVIIPYNAGNPNITIEAFIRADGGVFVAEKGEDLKGVLEFRGAITVQGKEEVETAVDLNAYENRFYTYNTDLMNNLSIPYMSFIANIIYWRESASSSDSFPPSF